jgi:three-Cys-motif partner protein
MATTRRRPDRLVVNRPHPDPCPDLVVEKNDDCRGVGRWVPDVKHTMLCRYIDAAYGAARRWQHWVFLDPFCGPGRILVAGETQTRPGGSVLAWQQSKASGTPFSHVFVGDLANDRLRACEARLLASAAPVRGFNDAAVESVKQMVQAVPASSLCLAYIDPYNLGFLDFRIFQTLAQLRKVDLIVNFFTSDLRRNVDAVGDNISPGWRTRIAGDLNKANLALAFFADWQQQVQALGFEVSQTMQLVKNSRSSEMYRLVFFARKQFPVGLWDDVAADPTPDLFATPEL